MAQSADASASESLSSISSSFASSFIIRSSDKNEESEVREEVPVTDQFVDVSEDGDVGQPLSVLSSDWKLEVNEGSNGILIYTNKAKGLVTLKLSSFYMSSMVECAAPLVDPCSTPEQDASASRCFSNAVYAVLSAVR